jgi:hypothetical protein
MGGYGQVHTQPHLVPFVMNISVLGITTSNKKYSIVPDKINGVAGKFFCSFAINLYKYIQPNAINNIVNDW